MIETRRSRPPSPHVPHSQLAVELALTFLAVVVALTLLRAFILVAGIGERTWTESLLFAATRPFVLPLELLPGGRRVILGAASLADLTTAALLLVLSVFVLSRPGKS